MFRACLCLRRAPAIPTRCDGRIPRSNSQISVSLLHTSVRRKEVFDHNQSPNLAMPAQERRKWHRPRNNDAAKNAASAGRPSPIARPPARQAPPANAADQVPNTESRPAPTIVNATGRPFAELKGSIDDGLLQGLDRMGFKHMTPVQQKVLTELPRRADCIVQAKTGTGKTIAFLLPAIQSLLQDAPPRGTVGILILSPTRELALQIAKEAKDVMASLRRKIAVHTAFGGTARASALKAFLEGDPTVLVATPGRLNDILGEEEVRIKCQNIKTVVLDEADRMLDQGFAPDVKKILAKIAPKQTGWQGMCFSATMTPAVMDVAKCVLRPGFTTLSTIDPDEAPTHERVPQLSVVVPTFGHTFPGLLALLQQEYARSPDDFKVIVFGTTANGVGLLFDLFQTILPNLPKFELQSRMSQPARTRTTQQFKDATVGILFASDVVGRGMDFPNVTLVVQVGLPSSAEQYIHRVGRTARAGKDGRSVIILSEQEAFFIHTNRSLPIQPYPVDILAHLPSCEATIAQAFTTVGDDAKSKAYQAFLGYNKTFMKKLQLAPAALVAVANDYSRSMGCPEPPVIEKSTVGKMGLKGVPGLRIGQRDRR